VLRKASLDDVRFGTRSAYEPAARFYLVTPSTIALLLCAKGLLEHANIGTSGAANAPQGATKKSPYFFGSPTITNGAHKLG
jgi:hypothetical protein